MVPLTIYQFRQPTICCTTKCLTGNDQVAHSSIPLQNDHYHTCKTAKPFCMTVSQKFLLRTGVRQHLDSFNNVNWQRCRLDSFIARKSAPLRY